jgi:exonuclease SbcC
MNVPADTESLDSLDSRQSILAAIHALLESSGGVDETRAKQVRRAIDALRNQHEEPPADGGDQAVAAPPALETGLDDQIDAGLESLRERVNHQVERRNRDYEKSRQLLDAVETALKANELQTAEHAYHTLMSVMGNIPGLSEQRWQDIEKRLNRVRPRLRKLESWRHWGTTQVRQELIEQIRQLPAAGLPPEELANRIRAARAQWQEWDKSGDHAGKALWQTFDSTCATAYQPCAEHFRQLKQQRKENLGQRQAIIDRLRERFENTDWKHPDWRELDRFVQQARRDFYQSGNVDFRRRKTIARSLDEVLEKFEDHLARERAHSLRVREKLIADIEALAAMENLHEALDRLDDLKKQWVVTVPGKRNVENRLWKRFQAACDGVYHRRDAKRRQHDAERQANLEQKQALVEELQRTAAAPDAELLAQAALPARLEERWQGIGAVPRKVESTLDKQWREARQRFRKALGKAEARNRRAGLDQLAQRATLCHAWEQAALTGQAIDAESARAQWQALPVLDDSRATAMEQRFLQACTRPDDDTLATNLDTKQVACLKLEVLLELPSPPEYQTARMAYQVERLNASLKKALDGQDSVEDLLYTVLTTGAVPAAAAGDVERRTLDCLDGYRNRS